EPADIQINFDRALYWIQCGAQPTDTVRSILSYKGVIYKNHLLKGVKKGALTLEQAEAKFQQWLSEKEAKIKAKANEHSLKIKELNKKRIEYENKLNEKRAQEISAKRAKEHLAQKTNDELQQTTSDSNINDKSSTEDSINKAE
ncbi:MAG TPA: 30S ribosomal protein S16, partial [Bacteroidales bacterium]|nr:30S ribosomal protein S16 [Bacteroidales bacterium]